MTKSSRMTDNFGLNSMKMELPFSEMGRLRVGKV